MVCLMAKELTLGEMEDNTLENGKMINNRDKELSQGQMEQFRKVFGKMEN